MKKRLVLTLAVFAITACSNNAKLDKKSENINQLVGEWSCRTSYDNINMATVDLITLNADGTVYDENYIFDNIFPYIKLENGGKLKLDPFKSPHKYLRVSSGTWDLNQNKITYDLKTEDFKNLTNAILLADMQKSTFFKSHEEKTFKSLAENKGGKIELDFEYLKKDGFVLSQTVGNISYLSYCTDKKLADYDFSKRLEDYKMNAYKNSDKK